MLPPLLTDADQSALVEAAYTGRLCAAATEWNLSPAAIQRTRAEVPAFAAALDAADDWLAMQLAESLRTAALDESTEAKVRIPLAKELLRQRPPSAWVRAKRTRPVPNDARAAAKTNPHRRVFEPEPRLTAESLLDQPLHDRPERPSSTSTSPSTSGLRADQLPDGQSVLDMTLDELVAWGDANDPRRLRGDPPPTG